MTTTSPTLTPTDAGQRSVGIPLVISALGFVLLYLAVDLVTPSLASSSLPLPNDPASDVRAWYADNQLAAVLIAALQALSVASLAGFAVLTQRAPVPVDSRLATRRRGAGLLAVALMLVSSACGCTLAAVAAGASLDTISVLRTANFVTGGTAHVLALGAFVLLTSRARAFGRALRVLGVVAFVPTVLSLSSLVVFEGAAFILLGRLLCMVWVLSAAVTIAARGRRSDIPASSTTPGMA